MTAHPWAIPTDTTSQIRIIGQPPSTQWTKRPVRARPLWDDSVEATLVARAASVIAAVMLRTAPLPAMGPLRIIGSPVAYARNNRLHRDGGPALIYQDGHKVWYQGGEIHRADGPAVIIKNRQKWFRRGKLHNWAAPAVQGYTETGERIERWFVYGADITEEAVAWMEAYGIREWPLDEAAQYAFAIHFGDRGQ